MLNQCVISGTGKPIRKKEKKKKHMYQTTIYTPPRQIRRHLRTSKKFKMLNYILQKACEEVPRLLPQVGKSLGWFRVRGRLYGMARLSLSVLQRDDHAVLLYAAAGQRQAVPRVRSQAAEDFVEAAVAFSGAVVGGVIEVQVSVKPVAQAAMARSVDAGVGMERSRGHD